MRRGAWWILGLPWLAACGGAQSSGGGTGEVEHGDAQADPSMLVLPSTDVDRDELSERMRFGWTLAEESFEVPMPPPPPSGDTGHYQDWADGELQGWLERKSRTVEAAREELDAAAEESHRQRIIAGAVVGLMYEDVARELRRIPVPAEIQTDPEIADIFRDILDAQASPYVEHARRAYRACALNAEGGPATMGHWSGFCADRRDGLPPPRE